MPSRRFLNSADEAICELVGEELHLQFPGIDSLQFENIDIVSELTIPRLAGVEVAINA